SVTTLLEMGVLKFVANISRIGCLLHSVSRTVNSGLSLITVLTPTKIASCKQRSLCTSILYSCDVIHLLSLIYVAIFPSNEVACFNVIYGRLRIMLVKKCLFISCASYFNNPVVTSTFALLSFSIPFPATRSFGSSVAICTFFKSLSIIASAHDPVFPTCEQGSSVTYIVASFAFSLAIFKAATSA